MNDDPDPPVRRDRRRFLQGTLGLGAGLVLPLPGMTAAADDGDLRLRIGPADAALQGPARRTVAAWGYNARVPGPVLRARHCALAFGGHRPWIIALDGHPHGPVRLGPDGPLVLGPAMRADLVIDGDADPGRRYAITDAFYERRSYELTDIAYGGSPVRDPARFEPPPRCRRTRCPSPTWTPPPATG